MLEDQIKQACIDGVMEGVRATMAYAIQNPGVGGYNAQQRVANLRDNALIMLSVIDEAFTTPVEQIPRK